MNRAQTIDRELHRIDSLRPSDGSHCEKHIKMAQNPFRFFRGSASLFYHDIATGTLSMPEELIHRIPVTNVVGDCHLSNFGFMTEEGSHGDTVIFAPNDFDDACAGHSVWDLVRFSTSLLLTQQYCDGLVKGHYDSADFLADPDIKAATTTGALKAINGFLESYLEQCVSIIEDKDMRDAVIFNFDKEHVLRKARRKAKNRAAGGKHFHTKSALAKSIDLNDLHPKFDLTQNKFKALDEPLFNEIHEVFSPYVDDLILDVTKRLGAGTGSVNMERFYLLVGPQDFFGEEDLNLCHIVEVKQQRYAAPLMHFEALSPMNRLNPAHLTVACQKRMQRKADLVLDEVEWKGHHWLVRSRHHARVGIDPEDIGLGIEDPDKQLYEYAQTCGSALALAHARGDRRSTRFEQAVVHTLPDYAGQVAELALMNMTRVLEDTLILQELMEAK